MNVLMDKLIGALCSDDYKGINNQYVDQGKVVICLKNINSVVGERSKSQEHCVHMKELVEGGVREHRDR